MARFLLLVRSRNAFNSFGTLKFLPVSPRIQSSTVCRMLSFPPFKMLSAFHIRHTDVPLLYLPFTTQFFSGFHVLNLPDRF